MVINTKNSSFQKKNMNNEKQEFDNPKMKEIFEFVRDRISFDELKVMEEKMGFKRTVFEIIKDGENINRNFAVYLVSEVSSKLFEKFDFLHTDEEFVKVALSRDSSLFKGIADKYKNNPKIGAIVVSTMVKENKNFNHVKEFIEKYFPKNRNELFKIYSKKLRSSEKFQKQDLSKILLILKEEDSEFYEKLLSQEIINKKNNINENFVLDFIENLKNIQGYNELKPDEKYSKRKEILLNLLLLNPQNITPEQEYLVKTILDLIILTENKTLVKKESKKEEKNEETDETKSKEEKKEESVDDFQEKVDYVYPNCVVESYPSGYQINTISGKKIKLSEKEFNEFNTSSLENYIKFYNTLDNLGLSFFLNKYNSSFKVACNNIGVNFYRLGGVTEGKTLSVLNMIGKAIGVPEEKIIGEDAQDTGKYSCFKDISEAKHLFAKINSSGYINGELYSEKGVFSSSAVENKLESIGFLDKDKGILNISNF